MFLKKRNNHKINSQSGGWRHALHNVSFFRTTTFRLTYLYLSVFSILSVAVFLVVYVSLALRLQKQMDSDLLDTLSESVAIYGDHGIRALRDDFDREAKAQGTDRLFLKLVNPDGRILASSDLTNWQSYDMPSIDIKPAENQRPQYKTVYLRAHRPGDHQWMKVRVVAMPIKGGKAIIIGSSVQSDDSILEKYRETFTGAFIIMVVLGGIFGFLLARKTMSGVQRVTDAATSIGRTDFSLRVPLADEGEEINSLARAFNGMLERIEVLLGELRQVTDNVAHELRTPVTRIRGIAETTLKGKDDIDSYKEMASSVIEGCDDLVEIIAVMLEIAQTDSGVTKLDMEAVDLWEIVYEASDLFFPMAEDKEIEIRLINPATAVMVLGDRRKLQRVVANILDNAVKYTPSKGKIIIEASVQGGNAVVIISNTGQEISTEDLPHIFDRFYRCDKSRSTSGSGLGLSLALSITRAHGGDIKVRSSDGRTDFIISIPTVSS